MTDKKALQSIHRYYKDCEHGFATMMDIMLFQLWAVVVS